MEAETNTKLKFNWLSTGWDECIIRVIFAIGVWSVVKPAAMWAYEVKPWKWIIVGVSSAQADVALAPDDEQGGASTIDEKDIAPQYRKAPKPVAWLNQQSR